MFLGLLHLGLSILRSNSWVILILLRSRISLMSMLVRDWSELHNWYILGLSCRVLWRMSNWLIQIVRNISWRVCKWRISLLIILFPSASIVSTIIGINVIRISWSRCHMCCNTVIAINTSLIHYCCYITTTALVLLVILRGIWLHNITINASIRVEICW